MPQKKSKTEWERSHTTWVSIKLNFNTDADILSYLENQPSKMGIIKAAVREYMENHRAEEE